MGNIYFKMGEHPKALKLYRMALDQTPTAEKDLRYKFWPLHNILFKNEKIPLIASAYSSLRGKRRVSLFVCTIWKFVIFITRMLNWTISVSGFDSAHNIYTQRHLHIWPNWSMHRRLEVKMRFWVLPGPEFLSHISFYHRGFCNSIAISFNAVSTGNYAPAITQFTQIAIKLLKLGNRKNVISNRNR